MFDSVGNLSYRSFYAPSTFLSSVGFLFRPALPSPCVPFSVPSRLLGANRQQITPGDLWLFLLRPVHIRHLWEFQQSQSHSVPREGANGEEEETHRDLSGDFFCFLSEQWEQLCREESRRCRPVCGWCCIPGAYTKKHVSKEPVCASAKVAKEGGWLYADAAQQVKVKG